MNQRNNFSGLYHLFYRGAQCNVYSGQTDAEITTNWLISLISFWKFRKASAASAALRIWIIDSLSLSALSSDVIS